MDIDTPAPNALNGEILRSELAAATGHTADDFRLLLKLGTLTVTAPDGADEQTVRDAVATHVGGDTSRPSVEDRLAEVERRLDNAPTATDLDELKSQLGGK